MKKLSVAAILVASLAVMLSGAALWRTRNINSRAKAPATAQPTVPTSSGSAAALVAVPNEVLKNAYAAGGDLTRIQLKFKVTSTPSVSTAKNKVMAQNPAPGTQVPIGSEVQLTVSSGPT